MAFGQSPGPPASAKQLAELSEQLERAGYTSFREARHIFGLTQRQANGRFTRDEAEEFLAQLESLDDEHSPDEPRNGSIEESPTHRESSRRVADRQAELVATLPDELLADELVRRGWMCMPPS